MSFLDSSIHATDCMFTYLFTVILFFSPHSHVSLFLSLFLQMPAERWRKCLTDISFFFEPVLGQMIVQEIFPQQTKKLVGIHLLISQAELNFISFFFWQANLRPHQGSKIMCRFYTFLHIPVLAHLPSLFVNERCQNKTLLSLLE